MPRTNEIVAHRLEQAKARIHQVYAEVIYGLGGEEFWTADDKGILDLIDERLHVIAAQKLDRIEQQWAARLHLGSNANGTNGNHRRT